MNLQIAICDDHKKDIQKLYDLLTACSIQMDIDLHSALFLSGSELIKSIETAPTFPYQLIFLDIEMPGENGIELARTLNRIMPTDAFLVFVSHFPEYMGESFSVHPFHFLQKPVSANDLTQLLSDVRSRLAKRERQLIIASKGGEEFSLSIDKILYITATNAKLLELTIHTWNDSYLKKGTLSETEASCSDFLFPLNRTTLVNLFHIHYLSENNVVLDNGVSLPVSVRCKKKLNGFFFCAF